MRVISFPTISRKIGEKDGTGQTGEELAPLSKHVIVIRSRMCWQPTSQDPVPGTLASAVDSGLPFLRVSVLSAGPSVRVPPSHPGR